MKNNRRNRRNGLTRQVLAMLLVAVMLVGFMSGGVMATEGETEPTAEATVPETTAAAEETQATEPEGTTAPTQTQPEETKATEPEATTAPTQTQPEETKATEPEETTAPTEPEETTAPTEPEVTQPQQTAYEKVMADLAAMEEEAKTLEATLEALNPFYDRLMAAWDAAQLLWEKGEISDDEMTAINEKAQAIVNYLKSEHGYENASINQLDEGIIGVVKNDIVIDAVVKLFDYPTTINTNGLAEDGYYFHHSTAYKDYIPKTITREATDHYTADGASDITSTFGIPKMDKTLTGSTPSGYPYASATSDSASGKKGSMKYLFDETYLKATMTDGGHLFQKSANGYYYYDSIDNAAWYDENQNRFVLNDVVISPAHSNLMYTYQSEDVTDVQAGNFLPFNPVMDTTAKSMASLTINDMPDAVKDNNASKGYTAITKLDQIETVQDDGTSRYYLTAPVDLWFGMTVEFDFNMPTDGKVNDNDMVFEFLGDDDVYVYIDDVLVLDIGGTHGAAAASINFATGEVINPENYGQMKGESTLKEIFEAAGKYKASEFEGDTFKDWTLHNLKFYYMERGGNISYCSLKFNMEPLPKGNVQVRKELDNNAVTDYVKEEIEFTFTLKNNTTGKIIANSPYTVTGDSTIRYTDENGQFKLKADQTASFNALEAKNEYLVEEGNSLVADLNTIKYNGNVIYDGVSDTQNDPFYVDPNNANQVHSLVYTNTVHETEFTVKKTVTGNMGDRNKEFEFTASLYADADKTKLISFPEPESDETYYTVENGVAKFKLKHGETGLTFGNIPLGAYVVITETAVDGYETTNDNGDGTVATLEKVIQPATVTFTNDKEVTIDTGIALDSMPFIVLLVGIAAIGLILFAPKRKIEE